MAKEEKPTSKNGSPISPIMNGHLVDQQELVTLLRDVQLRINNDLQALLVGQSQQLEDVIKTARNDILSELRHQHHPLSSEALSHLRAIVSKFDAAPQIAAPIRPDIAAPMRPGIASADPIRQPTEKSLRYSETTMKELDQEKAAKHKAQSHQWQEHVVSHFRSLAREKKEWRHFCMEWFRIDKSRQNIPDSWLSRIVHGKRFTSLTILVILCNVAWLAFAAQEDLYRAIESPDTDDDELHFVMTTVFGVIYITEWVIRIWSDRLAFVFGAAWGWNLFDTVMALSACTDIIVEAKIHHARVVGAYKWTKAFRVARLFKFFKGLRDVVSAMEASLSVLGWSLIMILLANLLVSIMFMQTLQIHIDKTNTIPEGTQEIWGNLEKAMITLFGCLTGGIDWLEAQRPLEDVGIGAKYVFITWAACMMLGMVNILIGLLSQKALASVKSDHQIATENQKDAMAKLSTAAKRLFNEMDVDRHGTITWEKFRDHLQDENVKAFFLSQELNVIDARGLFQLFEELDLQGDPKEEINCDAFTLGLMRLTGAAKSTDLFMLLHENRKQTEVLLDVARVLADAPYPTVEPISTPPLYLSQNLHHSHTSQDEKATSSTSEHKRDDPMIRDSRFNL